MIESGLNKISNTGSRYTFQSPDLTGLAGTTTLFVDASGVISWKVGTGSVQKISDYVTSASLSGYGLLAGTQSWSGLNTFGGTTTPTHSITLASTSTGFVHYNTVDQTTNYERVRGYWSGNIYNIATDKGGSGSNRGMFVNIGGSGLYVSNSASVAGAVRVTQGSISSATSLFGTIGTLSSSSGTQNGVIVAPNINQSGTASYKALLVSPLESTTGSGSKFLLDLGTNSGIDGSGTHTSKFNVLNDGSTGINTSTPNISSVLDIVSTTKGVLLPRMTTAEKNAISSPVEGLSVYDLTLHKLCVFTGSVWETITSS